MAEICAVIGLSHAPGLTGWLDKASPEVQTSLVQGFTELGRMLRATKPDVIIGIANDHLLNLPVDNTPDFCVGTAERWQGPAPWFKDWVNVPDYNVAGHRDLARTLVREAAADRVNFAFSDKLMFDDNFSVPLLYLTPKYDIPLVPIHMNCLMPPVPQPRRCYEVGQSIARIVREARPAGERVAIMATGGLSHDPGGPRYFAVDEKFDRWFLDLMAEGDDERTIAECTLDRLKAAGDGGTVELLAWFVAMGAAPNTSARTIVYEPAVALRCGMGCVNWQIN